VSPQSRVLAAPDPRATAGPAWTPRGSGHDWILPVSWRDDRASDVARSVVPARDRAVAVPGALPRPVVCRHLIRCLEARYCCPQPPAHRGCIARRSPARRAAAYGSPA
jgi:hypothetical protein